MEDKVDNLPTSSRTIESSMQPKKKWPARLLEFLEKLLLPLALGVLAYYANNASTMISAAQLDLMRSQEQRQSSEALENVQLKYIELFYQDITSTIPAKQKSALSLISLMRPDLGERIASWVQANSSLPGEIRDKAQQITNDYAVFGPLNGYKIGIYFLTSDGTSASQATDLRKRLLERGFKGTIQLYPVSVSVMSKLVPPAGNEIRYEPETEFEAADILSRTLGELYPVQSFNKLPVSNRTTNFISVFLTSHRAVAVD